MHDIEEADVEAAERRFLTTLSHAPIIACAVMSRYGGREEAEPLLDTATFTIHGGALDAALRAFPDAPRPWLDLSTGINPVAYPVAGLPHACWERLPSETDLRALERLAARRYCAPANAEVVAGPGTQALIQRLPLLCGGKDARLLGHTYGEFERVFAAGQRCVRTVGRPEELRGADAAVIVNPNNPDGRLVAVPDLLDLAGRVGTLVVDEAFVDALDPSASVVPLMQDRMIVLRSFGKIFGLAGLRLGFAILSRDRGAALRSMLGPWPVSGPALAVGRAALADDAWLEAARLRLAQDMARLSFLLRGVGATPIGGTPLFALVRHQAAPALFRHLGTAGLLVRPFAGEPSWLRFGAPGTEADWARLTAALSGFR